MYKTIVEYQKDVFLITTDVGKLDIVKLQEFLANSYWANTRPKEVILKSIQNSLCFSMFHGDQQIGFTRVVSDFSTFAYLCDVYVDQNYRGQRLGHWMIECVLQHPELQQLRRVMLATKDAHEFYQKFGFTSLSHPEKFMEMKAEAIANDKRTITTGVDS